MISELVETIRSSFSTLLNEPITSSCKNLNRDFYLYKNNDYISHIAVFKYYTFDKSKADKKKIEEFLEGTKQLLMDFYIINNSLNRTLIWITVQEDFYLTVELINEKGKIALNQTFNYSNND